MMQLFYIKDRLAFRQIKFYFNQVVELYTVEMRKRHTRRISLSLWTFRFSKSIQVEFVLMKI